MGAVSEGSLPDVEPAHSAVPAENHNDDQLYGRREALPSPEQPSPGPQAPDGSRGLRRNRGPGIFQIVRRVWIPLVVLAVIGAGGFTVSRLHGIFGSEKSISYGDTRNDPAKPLNPKHMRYEIFGAPGTVAQISYFDGNGDPQFVQGVSLPWSLEFPISTAGSIGSLAAQGDSDTIGCRILVDGVVKAEKTTVHEASSFASCVLKAA